MREWDRAKSQYLQPLFGDQLILKKPFYKELSETELLQQFDPKAEELLEMRRALTVIFTYEIINENKNEIIDSLLNNKTIINNLFIGESFTLYYTNGEKYKIFSGTKLLKIIKKILHGIEQETYNNFMNWCSRLRNQRVIQGNLCLSIHPLDFLTMSDNASSWTSCIAWNINDPGEYRVGTLECLNSSKIIIAYIENPNHPFIFSPNFSWNNKQWRELFIIDNSIISEIKGYPYQNECLTNAVINWLKELSKDNYSEEINLAQGVIEKNKITLHIIPQSKYFMYNDFGSLSSHRGFINYANLLDNYLHKKNNCYYEDDEKINYFIDLPFSGRATCACCGKYLQEIPSQKIKVLCEVCEPGFRCAYCCHWSDGEEYYLTEFSEDEPICKTCYDNFTSVDDISGEIFMSDSKIKLFWDKGDPDIYIEIKDPGYYSENEPYWEIFNSLPTLDSGNHYYITLEQVKDMDRFKKLFQQNKN